MEMKTNSELSEINKKSKSGEMWQLVEHLKIDGLPNAVRAHHIMLAAMWVLLLMVNATVCLWLIAQTCTQYSEHRVTTTTRYVTEQQSLFPSVTICNKNALTTSAALDLLATYNISIEGQTSANLTFKDLYDQLDENFFATHGDWLDDEQSAKLVDLDKMVVSCKFQGSQCNKVSAFVYRYHPTYVNCFVFNVNGSQSVLRAGKENNLQLLLYAGVSDGWLTFAATRGFYLFIQNSSINPFGQDETPYEITPGLGTDFVVRRVFYNAYPTPYSECSVLEHNKLASGVELDDSSVFTQFSSMDKYEYLQSECVVYCEQISIVDTCKCNEPTIIYKIGNDSTLCYTATQAECSTKVEEKFFSSLDMKKSCLAKCPLECNRYLIETSTYDYKYPWSNEEAFADAHKNNYANDDTDFKSNIVNNVVKVSIYYDSLAYVQVEEEPKMSWEDLLGILGGHLHLFLGMSVMSFVELFEFVGIFCVRTLKSTSKPS